MSTPLLPSPKRRKLIDKEDNNKSPHCDAGDRTCDDFPNNNNLTHGTLVASATLRNSSHHATGASTPSLSSDPCPSVIMGDKTDKHIDVVSADMFLNDRCSQFDISFTSDHHLHNASWSTLMRWQQKLECELLRINAVVRNRIQRECAAAHQTKLQYAEMTKKWFPKDEVSQCHQCHQCYPKSNADCWITEEQLQMFECDCLATPIISGGSTDTNKVEEESSQKPKSYLCRLCYQRHMSMASPQCVVCSAGIYLLPAVKNTSIFVGLSTCLNQTQYK